MQSWDRHWYGPVAAIRPYLFQKCLVVMVAMDLLVLMVERGGRYGLDAVPFNVPHFAWLQSFHQLFLPFAIPNAAYYVCVLVITSFFAFCLFLTGHRPWLMACVTIMYTYAWALSRLDSYLHHYMLTLVMSCMIFFPRIDPRTLREWTVQKSTTKRNRTRAGPRFGMLASILFALAVAYRLSLSRAIELPPMQRWVSMFVCAGLVAGCIFVWNKRQRDGVGPYVSAWAFRLLGTTVGVIYIFTSVAKMDMEWCGGHTLRQVGTTADVLSPVEQLAAAVGVPVDWFWSGLATFVIPLELTLAFSYLIAVRQDEEGRVWLRRWCFFAWLLAIGLHLNNEMMSLVIQWFGYYMLMLATLVLMPARILLTLGVVFVWPESWLRDQYERWLAGLTSGQSAAALGLISTAAIIGLTLCGYYIWIAGAILGSMVVAAGLVAVLVCGMILGWERKSVTVSLAAFAASLLMVGAVAQCSMRFDYYDLRGKTLQNLGDHLGAIKEMELAAQLTAASKPAKAELLTNLGLSYRYAGDVKKSMMSYRKAIGLDPKQFLACYGLANLLMDDKVHSQKIAQQSRHDDAEHYYRQAISMKPDFSDAWVNLGNLLEYRNQLEQAITCYETALAIEKDAADIQKMLQRVREKKASSVK